MHNIKQIVSFAIFGFILSLVCGFFSNSSFISIVLTAFGWAIGFALLGFFVSLVFNKFLKTDDSSDYSQSSSNSIPVRSSSVGNNVDIVIEDQELERTDSSNRYTVNENRQMLNDSDISNNKHNEFSSVNSSDNDFVPIRNLETYKNFSGTESKTSSQIDNGSQTSIRNLENSVTSNIESSASDNSFVSKENSKATSNDLDVLPDMGDFVIESNNNNSNEEDSEDVDSVYENSGNFSESTFSTKRNENIDNENMQNTELIAKAISSVLSQET